MATSQSKPLNICLIAFRFPIQGRATDNGFLWPIAKGLAQMGHSVTVISGRSPIGKPEVNRDGVRVFFLYEGFPNSSHLKFDKAAYEKFKSLHRENAFDIVHSIDRSGMLIGLNKNELKTHVAYDVEATQMSQLFAIIGMAQENARNLLLTGIALIYKFCSTYFGGDRQLLNTADGVFVTTPNQRVFLERYYLYPDFHTYTVPYGIEIGNLTTSNETSIQLRKKYNIPEGAHLAVTITDMSEPKEIEVLLEAFERVAVKKSNAFMIIIGNGPHWFEIEHKLLSLALGSRVIMTGALPPDEISDWISITDIYINLSSRTTGFETSMIEAMAQKKIIIGSEVSPISHIVEDSKDGFLIRPADMETLAHIMIELFSDRLPKQEIGLHAQEKVTNLLDTRKMIHSVEDAYRHILATS